MPTTATPDPVAPNIVSNDNLRPRSPLLLGSRRHLCTINNTQPSSISVSFSVKSPTLRRHINNRATISSPPLTSPSSDPSPSLDLSSSFHTRLHLQIRCCHCRFITVLPLLFHHLLVVACSAPTPSKIEWFRSVLIGSQPIYPSLSG